jgi:C4-dicarboxylate transporter DctM subunit
MTLDPFALVGIGITCMFALIAMHVPLGVAMGASGVVGFALLSGWKPALSLMASETASVFSSLDLATIPFFILMGGFASAAGLSEDLYRIAYAMVGHRRGGLAAATIAGCAGFGAVCGSSVATTATFGRIALPSMLQRNYAPGFATGTIAAGGTLGILVPPSVIMVIYAVLAQELIITLYVAAIVPALLAVTLHFLAIALYVRTNPGAAPAADRMPWKDRWRVLRGGWAVILLIVTVLAGMSFGVFTATEAAAIGALLAFLFALVRGSLDRMVVRATLMESASTTGMIYVIIVGAALFGYFVEVSQAPRAIVEAIRDSGLPVPIILAMMMAIYLVLGAIFDEVAVLVIRLPFVLPLIKSWGYDPVWWGIINVVVVELGMLIPPLGMNVFVIYSIAKKVPLTEIYRGAMPYIVSNLARLALLLTFPMLTLWVPRLLRG